MVTLPYDDAVTATTALAPARSGERTRFGLLHEGLYFRRIEFPEGVGRVLERRADDGAVRHARDLGEVLGGDAAADEDRHRAGLLACGRDQRERLLVGLAGEDQSVGAPEADGEIDVLGEAAARHRVAGAVMHVGEDRHMRRVAGVAGLDRGEGLRRLEPERRHHGADIDLDAHEVGVRRGGHRQHRLGVVLEEIEAHWTAEARADLGGDPRHPGDLSPQSHAPRPAGRRISAPSARRCRWRREFSASAIARSRIVPMGPPV